MAWGLHTVVYLGVILAYTGYVAESAGDCPAGQGPADLQKDVALARWPKNLDKLDAKKLFVKKNTVVDSPAGFTLTPKNGASLNLMGLTVMANGAVSVLLNVESGGFQVEKLKAEFSKDKAELNLPEKGIKKITSLKITIKGKEGQMTLRRIQLILCKDIDECIETPCVHGACRNKKVGYHCECDSGWTGKNCDINIDDCSPNPCANNAECQDKVNGYSCTCVPGWTGKHCDTNIDDCATKPCAHGDCIDGVNGYKCKCDEGWKGKHCRTNINDCSPDPCKNGKCVDLVGGYRCRCRVGWTGEQCNRNIDDCASNPCVRGQCSDGLNAYKCNCDPGWTGINCDEDIDECASSPCSKRGYCTDKDNGYECFCKKGWAGKECKIRAETDDRCPSNYMRFDLTGENAQFYNLNIHPNIKDQDAVWGVDGAKFDDGHHAFLRMNGNDRYTIAFKERYNKVLLYVGQLCMRTFVVDLVTIEFIAKGKNPRIVQMVPVKGPEWFRLACTPEVYRFERVDSILITYKHQPPNFNMKDMNMEACIPLGIL